MVTVEHSVEGAGQLAPGEVAFTAVGVKKHYPGVKALDGVDLEGYAGEVLAVCGANGAGKSTFAKLLAGVETPTDGEIRVTGYPHPVRNAAEAEQAGVLDDAPGTADHRRLHGRRERLVVQAATG